MGGLSSTEMAPLLDAGAVRHNALEVGVEWQESLQNLVPAASEEGTNSSGDEAAKESLSGAAQEYRNVISWLPARKETGEHAVIKGIVLISHGMLAHGMAHHKEGIAFAKAGFATYAMDHVGHGLSSGQKGLIPSADGIVDDFVCFAQSMQAKHAAGTPVVLFGHSLGSTIIASAFENITDVAVFMTTGCPYIAGPASASIFGIRSLYPLSQLSFVAKIGQVMACIDPSGPVAPLDANEVTSSSELLELNSRDPRRYHHWICNMTAATSLQLVDKLKYTDCLRNIHVPALLYHGALDTIAYPEGTKEVYAKLGTSVDKKAIKIVPGLKHEICAEVDPLSSQVVSEIVDFASDQVGSGVGQKQKQVKVVSKRLVPMPVPVLGSSA